MSIEKIKEKIKKDIKEHKEMKEFMDYNVYKAVLNTYREILRLL